MTNPPVSNPPSLELLRRARAGDNSALDRLFQRYLPSLHRWAHGRIPRWARNSVDTADVVQETMAGGYTELRMSAEVLDAALALRTFLFDAVYENETATTEFKKATGILGGLWEAVRSRPAEFVDRTIMEKDGLDTAVCDFIAGMTDRYAVALYERLFIPTPWVG